MVYITYVLNMEPALPVVVLQTGRYLTCLFFNTSGVVIELFHLKIYMMKSLFDIYER